MGSIVTVSLGQITVYKFSPSVQALVNSQHVVPLL